MIVREGKYVVWRMSIEDAVDIAAFLRETTSPTDHAWHDADALEWAALGCQEQCPGCGSDCDFRAPYVGLERTHSHGGSDRGCLWRKDCIEEQARQKDIRERERIMAVLTKIGVTK